MVTLSAHYNFRSVVEEFLALKTFKGPHADMLRHMVRTRAFDILAHHDIRYMPAFKILDLMAELVNAADAIAIEPQLRANEAAALLQSQMSDHSPLIRQFMLEAALERARYEPMMLDATGYDAATYRTLTLQKRWAAMLAAHNALVELPDFWSQELTRAVHEVITAEPFRDYRQGPLLQFFAEMLTTARTLYTQGESHTILLDALGPKSALWKRYALKAARYREQPHENAEGDLPLQSRVPMAHLRPPHSVH